MTDPGATDGFDSSDWTDREVHIWRVPLDAPPLASEALAALLDETERQRARRFHFEHDRRRWVAARSALRTILSLYTGVSGERLRFGTTPHGKPYLMSDNGPVELCFNLTHSGELALVAVGRTAVGVDAEHTGRNIDWTLLAPEVFSLREQAERLPRTGRSECLSFFDLWTLKEAYLKGRGCGLTIPPSAFELSESAADGTYHVRIAPAADDGLDWQLRRLSVGADYAAAVACARAVDRIRHFAWPVPDYRAGSSTGDEKVT